jgi:hypothetical protein
MPPHVLLGLCGSPLGRGCSVTDFGDWDAQRARLRCPDDDGKVKDESVVPGGVSKLISTNYPDHGRRGRFSYLMEKRPWKSRESNPGPHGE